MRYTLIVVASVLLMASKGHADPHGSGWEALSSKVDPLVEAYMAQQDVPGMSVAISVDGRLVHSKGYGFAKYDEASSPPDTIPMRDDHRVRFGSTAKAMLTGPSGYLALTENGRSIDSKLYGPQGLFGNRFNSEIEKGVKRHYPIVAMAIGPEDKVHAWYVDGTYSIGTSRNLGAYQEPRPFVPGATKSVRDIVAIAIAGDGDVYTWYSDGKRSIGNPSDLGANSQPDTLASVKSIGAGRRMLNILGAAIAKSNDHVYVYWDDGKVSSGTSQDLTYYIKPRNFRNAGDRYGIRGVGISDNDTVYVWGSDERVRVGSSTDLGRRSPYSYTTPYRERLTDNLNPRIWYAAMTARQLFEHRTGFQGSGDVKGTEGMFGVANPSYDQIHRYFLSTRRLLSPPGANYNYSNHGYGLWTLLVPELTGLEYRVYAVERILNPAGLKGRIRPESTRTDDADSFYHFRDSTGRMVAKPNEESTVGLAAGGWTANASDMIALTNWMADRYTFEELDLMGWFAQGKKLEHLGARGSGGASYVAFYPDSGNRVHVAVASNFTPEDASTLEMLAMSLLPFIGQANIPNTYDLWN